MNTLNYPSINGTWTYRALLNNPIPVKNFDDLKFAQATMLLKNDSMDQISGKLDMGEYGVLNIKGHFTSSSVFRLTGTGVPNTNTAGWVYDYHGYVVPIWDGENGEPKSVDQKRTLVGSVIRTVAHEGSDGSIHPAGDTASFYMVLRDTLS